MLADRLERAVDRVLLVYAKQPLPGHVKTRLIGALGAQRAAELHEAMLRDLLAALGAGSFRLELRWDGVGGGGPLDLGLPWALQEGADLGTRLWAGLSGAASSGSLVAAVGSDTPDLLPARVDLAFDWLERNADVVLGPTRDGGYYLIALRPECVRSELFEPMPWSTAALCAATTARCRALGLRWRLLPEAADVDTPADLARLAARLSAAGEACPRTRALLARWEWGSAA